MDTRKSLYSSVGVPSEISSFWNYVLSTPITDENVVSKIPDFITFSEITHEEAIKFSNKSRVGDTTHDVTYSYNLEKFARFFGTFYGIFLDKKLIGVGSVVKMNEIAFRIDQLVVSKEYRKEGYSVLLMKLLYSSGRNLFKIDNIFFSTTYKLSLSPFKSIKTYSLKVSHYTLKEKLAKKISENMFSRPSPVTLSKLQYDVKEAENGAMVSGKNFYILLEDWSYSTTVGMHNIVKIHECKYTDSSRVDMINAIIKEYNPRFIFSQQQIDVKCEDGKTIYCYQFGNEDISNKIDYIFHY